jgi:hypothetical protein
MDGELKRRPGQFGKRMVTAESAKGTLSVFLDRPILNEWEISGSAVLV